MAADPHFAEIQVEEVESHWLLEAVDNFAVKHYLHMLVRRVEDNSRVVPQHRHFEVELGTVAVDNLVVD
jgi:hypothetical protein